MNTVSHKENFVKILSAFLFILFFSKPLYTQITVSQSEFLEIFTPGLPLHVIDGESGLINIGNTAGANIYDFTFVDIQDMYTLYNFQVGSIPILAARYPSIAHTFGEGLLNIEDNPVFYSSNDSSYFIGAATIENEYRFTHYVPYELYSKFPVSYGSSFSQFIEIWDTTYNLNWQIIQTSFYTSQQNIEVDGFGTLKLPGFDLECLRQKRVYPSYGYKDFHFITREGILLVVDSVPLNEPDTGFVNGDYTVLISSEFVSVEDKESIPFEFSLIQNYPNPFNPSTKIGFLIANPGFVSLKVYDVLGNEVATLVNEELSAGEYEIEFVPASSVSYPASSVYFYQLVSSSYIETRKMILMK